MKKILLALAMLLLTVILFLVACTPEYNLRKEFYSKVTGVTFENEDGVNRQDLLRKLNSGAKLELRMEPENPHDDNAVEIYSSVGKIGYIKRDLAAYITTLLEKKVRVIVEVEEITGGGPSLLYGCNIKISIYD